MDAHVVSIPRRSDPFAGWTAESAVAVVGALVALPDEQDWQPRMTERRCMAEQALEMTPDDLVAIGDRAGQLFSARIDGQVWPNGPRSSARPMIVAFIEALEGSRRPPARNRRLPARSLPVRL